MVNIQDPHALEILAGIEGQEWKREQLKNPDSPFSDEFRTKFKELLNRKDDEGIMDLLEGKVVRGNQNVSRYGIKLNGDLEFSGRHSSDPEKRRKVTEAGIDIYE